VQQVIYYGWLRPICSRVDVWMTTYVHPFDGPQGIADWFAGSALQPFLERLHDEERCAFRTSGVMRLP